MLVSCARHAGGRLVEQQQPRVLHQAHRQLQPALVAARQAAGDRHAAGSARPTSSSMCLGLVADLGLARRRADQSVDRNAPSRLREGRDHDVLEQRQVGEDLRRLEHPRDAQLVDLVRLACRSATWPSKTTAPLSGASRPTKHVEQRRLAGAVRADDRVRRRLPRSARSMSFSACSPPKFLLTLVDVEDDIAFAMRHRATPPAGRARAGLRAGVPGA